MINLSETFKAFSTRSNKNDKKDRIVRPRWLDQYKDSLQYFFFRQEKIIEEGVIAPGALVKSNEKIYKRPLPWRNVDHPAYFIYSKDEYYVSEPEKLYSLAMKILSVNEKEKFTQDDRKVENWFKGGKERPIHQKVPDSYTDGREVYFTTIIISRKAIPGGRIKDEHIYPLLVVDDNKADAMMIPCKYWRQEK